MHNFFDTNLSKLHEQLVNKEISAQELTKQTLANIQAIDKTYHAFLSTNETGALNKAKKIDEQGISHDQILAGIPIALKDNIVTKEGVTTAGSKILENFQSIYDATVVEKLDQANAINIGKTNLDEFAMGSSTETSAFGPTRNAWDITRVPGGSSGGSAAAVASGQVLASLGSDTGGSIRQPAAFNGIVGVKPTYGRISRWGLIAFGSSFDQIGPFTRTVEDNALLLNRLVGYDTRDTTSYQEKSSADFTKKITQGVKGIRIAVPKEYFEDGIDQVIQDKVKQAIQTLEKLGAIVEEVSLPHTKYGVAAYYILASSEASSNLQRFDGVRYGYSNRNGKSLEEMYVDTRTNGFGDEVKRRIMLGTFSLSAGFYDAYFKKAAQVRTKIIEDFEQVFENHDVIIGPTTPMPSYHFGDESDPRTIYMNDVLTIPVNMAGLPGLSINAGFTENHLPVGMQIISKAFDEQTMYQVASAFEQETQLYKQLPNIAGVNNE